MAVGFPKKFQIAMETAFDQVNGRDDLVDLPICYRVCRKIGEHLMQLNSKVFTSTCAAACSLLASTSAFSQHPQALYVVYPTPIGGGDLVINRVRSTAIAPNTYFEVFGWNPGGEAGGYTGIQLGTNRNMIFSIWDPSNHLPISVIYQEPGSRSNPFGGEGTGLHWDNTPLGNSWNLNTWYTFVCRSWPVGTGANAHTQFAMWTLDESNGKWTHHVTMDFPMAAQNFNFGMNSFLELWAGYDPVFRRVEFRDAWMRRAGGAWSYLCGPGTWTDGGLINPPAGVSACGGVTNGAIFLQSGELYQANANAAVPLPPSARPEHPIAAVINGGGRFDPITNEFSVYWAIDEMRAPQWSYRLELFASPDGSGSPILTREEISPNARSVPYTLSQLPHGHYSAKITVRDIFDRDAPPYLFTFDRFEVERAFISDLAWSSSTNGWGPVERDRSNGESGAADGSTITLDGLTYAKGIGCHANSHISVDLRGRYWEFCANVGVDDEVLANGSVVFRVILDGVPVLSSPTLTGASATFPIRVDVRGVEILRLEVLDGSDGNGADHADWAGASVLELVCPIITLQPDAGLACPSETVAFAISAAGTGPFAYEWQHELAGGDWVTLVEGSNGGVGTVDGAHTPTLRISQFGPIAGGLYRCRVTNACGATTSNSKMLLICVADYNCDDTVDFFDYLDFVAVFSDGSSGADFNNDSVVDFFDYLDFVAAFSEGC